MTKISWNRISKANRTIDGEFQYLQQRIGQILSFLRGLKFYLRIQHLKTVIQGPNVSRSL